MPKAPLLGMKQREKRNNNNNKKQPSTKLKDALRTDLKKQQGCMAIGHLFQNQLWLLSRHMLHKEQNCQTGIDTRGIILKNLFSFQKMNICSWREPDC